jgi:hypothetical protein
MCYREIISVCSEVIRNTQIQRVGRTYDVVLLSLVVLLDCEVLMN